ncbi:MAG: ATP-binding cassette domain-containing protein [Planctomycetaceae bacterium]|jgi:phospholipid/cholesterol/gamma-HCH transport system ATP-binding protein|nr:ATP-binding cassette domain-containing protein [Planctomycetaceae bacterium]MBT6157593.1 ATP-binding cassette domain-containing protein [Planctomycetaceae bacterium]MBT6486191.1 ATP-binding cassette domain-containing protein [Planctomycetaceae bacterium]MBT6497856.1 ATP-binding cassette domain-containing protein [Planctomycetaceae bacterium]
MPTPPETNNPPSIALKHVWKKFETQPVLRDISIEVEPNETLALIGESGCGKSVTMKLMMSLLEPSRGEVFWSGRPVKSRSDAELTRERLQFGYLFQGAALFDSLTVYENVAFALKQNTRMPEERIREIVYERLKEVGLTESICSRKPAELSGGMKKRVGLARALALSPDVMLYDEPTTGLDPIMSDVINELILQTRARRPVTSIVVTHDMRTVEKVADRVIMFYPLSRLKNDEPQIVFSGTYEEALASTDPRVTTFVRGQAGERIQEMALSL